MARLTERCVSLHALIVSGVASFAFSALIAAVAHSASGIQGSELLALWVGFWILGFVVMMTVSVFATGPGGCCRLWPGAFGLTLMWLVGTTSSSALLASCCRDFAPIEVGGEALAFQLFVVGLLVPITINWVIRVYDKYNYSRVTARFLLRDPLLLGLLGVTFPTVVLAFVLVSVSGTAASLGFRANLAWFVVIGVAAEFVLFLLFLWRVFTTYILDEPDCLLRMLYGRALSVGDDGLEAAELLMADIQALGGILESLTSAGTRNAVVRDGVKQVAGFVQSLVDAWATRLLSGREWWGSASQDEVRAIVASALERLVRIHAAALRSQNFEVATVVAYAFSDVVSTTSESEQHSAFLGLALNAMQDCTLEELRSSSPGRLNNSSLHALTWSWFSSVVFTDPRLRDRPFELSLLPQLASHLWMNATYIIDNQYEGVFESLVSYMWDGIGMHRFPREHLHDLWDHLDWDEPNPTKRQENHALLGRRIDQLTAAQSKLRSSDHLEKWLTDLELFESEVRGAFPPEKGSEVRAVFELARDEAMDAFKQSSLEEFVFSLASYCMFAKRYRFLSYMLQYQNPPDSDASWGSNDVLSTNVDYVLHRFATRSSFEFERRYYGDHHGSAQYERRMAVLLLGRSMLSLARQWPTSPPKPSMSQFGHTALGDMPDQVGMIEAEIPKILANPGLLAAVPMGRREAWIVFHRLMPAYLRSVKVASGAERIRKVAAENLDPEAVERFGKCALKAFEEAASFQTVMSRLELLEDKRDTARPELDGIGYYITLDKLSFVRDSNYDSSFLAGQLGEGVASGEAQRALFQPLLGRVEEREGPLSLALEELVKDDEWVLFAPYRLFARGPVPGVDFVSRRDGGADESEPQELTGWVRFGGTRVRVYRVDEVPDGDVLLLRIPDIGCLVRYHPGLTDDEPNTVFGPLYCRVTPLEADSRAVQNFKAEPPEWLLDIPAGATQDEMIANKVLLRMGVRSLLEGGTTTAGALIHVWG